MASLETLRKLRNTSYSPTIGNQLKQVSDFAMQETWYNDIQTRTCYLYDFFTDDQFDDEKCYGYDPSLSKSKIKVDLKFIIKEYKSLAKDNPEYHIMFSPDDWNKRFKITDGVMDNLIPDNESQMKLKEIFEERTSKYGIVFPIGIYIDIPDDKGIYWKWLVVYEEVANQFPKFGVLKCNYLFRWIKNDGVNRYKRCMWGVQRSQNSYNSGLYVDKITTEIESVSKFWLPYNSISSELYYNQRIIVSMPMETPITYVISKVENTIPKGVSMFTIQQDEFNQHTDLVCLVDNHPDFKFGEMYADYFQPNEKSPIIEQETPSTPLLLSLNVAKANIRIGGNYKTITAVIKDENNIDVTNQYLNDITWDWNIEGDNTNNLVVIKNDIKNIFKIKLSEKINEAYFGKTLTVNCSVKNIQQKVDLDITAL